MEMEKLLTATSFPLNYDCTFELLLWLGFDECMNMAETYEGLQPIADRVYKRKFNKLAFDFQQPIDRILYHAGPTAKSLTLTFSTFDNLQTDLDNIVKTCKQLQCLTLNELNVKKLVNHPFAHIATDHLQMLTLNQCSLEEDVHFFDGYTKLKYLNLNKCRKVDIISMKKCFERNQGITSFVCNVQYFFYPTLLQLLPNLKKLNLRYNSRYMELGVLSKLESLRHLTLVCFLENVNDALVALAKVNRLEELVLIDVVPDDKTFPLIKKLETLQLLAAISDRCHFPSSSDLPPNLKALKLGGCGIADNAIASTLKHLKHLRAIHLQNCEWERNGVWIGDFDSLADFVVDEVIAEHPHRHLNVELVSFYDQTPEVSVEEIQQNEKTLKINWRRFLFTDNRSSRTSSDHQF